MFLHPCMFLHVMYDLCFLNEVFEVLCFFTRYARVAFRIVTAQYHDFDKMRHANSVDEAQATRLISSSQS